MTAKMTSSIEATATITKEKKPMTATKTTTAKAAPASDPQPTVKAVRKPTRREAAKATVVPEPTDAQKARMFSTAMGAVTRAMKAADAVVVDPDDVRTLDRKNHLLEKAIIAKVKANEVAAKAGKEEPFPGDQAVFVPISLPEKEADEPTAESPTAAAGFEITLRNMTDGSIEGHAAGCADLKRKAKRGHAQPSDEPWTFTVATKHEAWTEYNSDFLAEHDPEPECDHDAGTCGHAWSINWLPCADDVPETATEVKAKVEPFKATAPKAARGVKAAKGATATAAGKKAATATPAKARKAATPNVVVTPAQRSADKATALASEATTAGWTVEISDHGDTGKVVAMAKADERLTVWFIDGKLDLNEMPKYSSDARPKPVILRNVSAVKKQMDADPEKRPVSAAPQRAAGRRSSDSPRKVFTWDDALDDAALLEQFATEWAGRRLHWDTRLVEGTEPEPQEALVGKVVKVERNAKSNDRIVSFFTLEWSDKEKGMLKGAQRTVALKFVRKVI